MLQFISLDLGKKDVNRIYKVKLSLKLNLSCTVITLQLGLQLYTVMCVITDGLSAANQIHLREQVKHPEPVSAKT